VLCNSQDHLRTRIHVLDHPVLASVENTHSWRARNGNLQRPFPLDVLMVPSSVRAITSDGKHLMCGGFSLSETVLFGSFKFIADYFDSLRLSPRRGSSGATFMGSTRSGTPSPWRDMIEGTVASQLRKGRYQPLGKCRQEEWCARVTVTLTCCSTKAIATSKPKKVLCWH
jgi:hypothetical protein